MRPVENPPNPFASYDCEYYLGDIPPARLEIYEDQTRSILSKNDSPDLPFTYSLNPYRGCAHACAYCYARPSHEYLGFGAGSDFENKILIKRRAPELLREAFMKKSWKGERVVFSGDTDCYQPIEASYQLTRQCLEVCLEFGNPAAIITKSFLVVRDLELFKKLHERTHVRVNISIPFWDEKTARLVEPRASAVSKRFEAVRMFADAGIHVGVAVAPVIPGLNDSDIARILKKAAECGAKSSWMTLLRLPGNVKSVFLARMKELFPMAYDKIEGRIRDSRGGELYNSAFGQRHRGQGEYWDNLRQMFEVYCAKSGLNREMKRESRPPFHRPSKQAELFS